MDIQIRIVLLVVGLLILLGVVIDFIRRRPARRTTARNDLQDYDHIEPHVMLEPQVDYDYQHDYASEPESESEYQYGLDLESESEPEESETKPAPRVISIYIMSRDRHGFKGADLLNAATNAHFYFGKKDVFHRFENEDGSGQLLFSLIKAHEPGYFYIDLLKQEHISGIALIMLPDELENSALALDKLIRAAKQIAFALNGELLDNNRQALTLTTLNDYAVQLKTNAH